MTHARSPDGDDTPFLFVDVTELPAGCRLVVAGTVDLSTSDALRAALADAVERGGDIEIDLFQVGFMDSQGLNALCAARAALPDDRRLRVFDSSGPVRRLLEITGLDEVFGLDRANPPREADAIHDDEPTSP